MAEPERRDPPSPEEIEAEVKQLFEDAEQKLQLLERLQVLQSHKQEVTRSH